MYFIRWMLHVFNNYFITDGNSLRLEEILEMISAEKRNAITANKLISISQNEHPFLGICFYQIHPCNTHTLMKEMNSKNYVIRSLSCSVLSRFIFLAFPFLILYDNIVYKFFFSWLSILLSLLPVVDLPNELFENLQ